MLNGDALLSFLALAGTGGWQTFERALEDVTDRQGQSYYAARAFCARGLLEFDWAGNRSWYVPPLAIVRLEAGRFLGIGLVDSETSSLLLNNGFVIVSNVAILTNNITYTRSEIMDPQGLGVETLGQFGEYFRLEPTAVDAGRELLDALPQIGSIIDSRPQLSVQDAIADGEVRFLDLHTLTFTQESQDTQARVNFGILRVRRQFAPPEYYYADPRGARRIELELGLAYAAARSGAAFLHHGERTLVISRAVPLPILVERALYFSGARFLGFRRAMRDGKSYACFADVAVSTARGIAMKLLTSLEPLPELEEIP